MENVSLKEVIGRLKTIENEVTQLLTRLEPLASRLYHAEDALLETVFGSSIGGESPVEEPREGAKQSSTTGDRHPR